MRLATSARLLNCTDRSEFRNFRSDRRVSPVRFWDGKGRRLGTVFRPILRFHTDLGLPPRALTELLGYICENQLSVLSSDFVVSNGTLTVEAPKGP